MPYYDLPFATNILLEQEDHYVFPYTWFPVIDPYNYNYLYYSTHIVEIENICTGVYPGLLPSARQPATSSLAQSTIRDIDSIIKKKVGDTSTTTRNYYHDDLHTSSSQSYDNYVQEQWEEELDNEWLYYESTHNYDTDTYLWFNKYDYAEAHGWLYEYRLNEFPTDEFPKFYYGDGEVEEPLEPGTFLVDRVPGADVPVEVDVPTTSSYSESLDSTWVLQVQENVSETTSSGTSTSSSEDSSNYTSSTAGSTSESGGLSVGTPISSSSSSSGGPEYHPDSESDQYSTSTASSADKSASTGAPATAHYSLGAAIGRDLATRFGITATTLAELGTDSPNFLSNFSDIDVAYTLNQPVLGDVFPYTYSDGSTTPSLDSTELHEEFWPAPVHAG